MALQSAEQRITHHQLKDFSNMFGQLVYREPAWRKGR